MSENDTLTAKQARAVEVWTATGNAAEACRAAGIARKTFYRWLRMRAFVAAVDAAQAQALEKLQLDLLRLAGLAGNAFEAALTDPEAAHAVKIRAADSVMSHLLHIRELTELERRLSELEAKLK